jgi:tetratricopeptide (TPR) repeat protein
VSENYALAFAGQSLADVLQYGLRQHQAGALDQALTAYRYVLSLQPEQADALHLLGILAYQQGRHAEAVDSIGRAIRQHRDRAPYHGNLGLALSALGRIEEAAAAYRQAVKLDPTYLEGHNNLGNILRSTGQPVAAEASYRRALRLQPNHPVLVNNLASVLLAQARLAEAAEAYRHAIALQPDLAAAYAGLAETLGRSGRFADAEASFREALRLDPRLVEAHDNLGQVLLGLGRLVDAEASFRAALALQPGRAEAWTGLGTALLDQGRHGEAETAFRTALQAKPDLAAAHHGLGHVLYELDRLVESEASCRAAIVSDPEHASAHHNLAHLLLVTGRLDEGWRHFEWRHALPTADRRRFVPPRWQGEPIEGRTLLIHAEQGLGDTLQFCRFVKLLAAMSNTSRARLVFEVQPQLRRLMSGFGTVAEIVARGEELPAFDLHCPLMSLPGVLGMELETIPADIPYLTVEPERAALWRERLASLEGLRVGLVWAGGLRPERPDLDRVDARRSMALERLAPLAAIPGVSFVSLQKGKAAEAPGPLALHDYSEALDDFADTAALIDALDLVIGVDTAVPHLAGALGKPVWLMNRHDTCWRWLLDRDDSPWYPTLRQFRQQTRGDWDSVVADVATALGRLAAGHG